MKLAPSFVHYIQVACAAISAGALVWAQNDSSHAAVAHALAAAAGSVLTVLGVLSGAAVQPKPPVNSDPELH